MLDDDILNQAVKENKMEGEVRREASKEVPDSFLIRENDSDWREPLVEVADEH